jgi:hypothetical protein
VIATCSSAASATLLAELSRRAGSPIARLGGGPWGAGLSSLDIWRAHQPDRAWIEWGLCWPPVSISPPRCVTCPQTRWPCQPALAAAETLVRGGLASQVRVYTRDRRLGC